MPTLTFAFVVARAATAEQLSAEESSGDRGTATILG